MVSATWPQRPSTQQAPKRSPSHFTPGSHPPARPLCAAFLGNPLVPITIAPFFSASRWRRALGAPAALPALSSAIQDLPGSALVTVLSRGPCALEDVTQC